MLSLRNVLYDTQRMTTALDLRSQPERIEFAIAPFGLRQDGRRRAVALAQGMLMVVEGGAWFSPPE